MHSDLYTPNSFIKQSATGGIPDILVDIAVASPEIRVVVSALGILAGIAVEVSTIVAPVLFPALADRIAAVRVVAFLRTKSLQSSLCVVRFFFVAAPLAAAGAAVHIA